MHNWPKQDREKHDGGRGGEGGVVGGWASTCSIYRPGTRSLRAELPLRLLSWVTSQWRCQGQTP